MPGALRRTLRLHSVRNPIGSKRPPVTQGSVPKRHRELILFWSLERSANGKTCRRDMTMPALEGRTDVPANGDTSEYHPKQTLDHLELYRLSLTLELRALGV